jgi:type I site-specific restriction endonuclease
LNCPKENLSFGLFTPVSFIYRQLKFAGARRVLLLVDRANLGRQTLKEFQQYQSPYTPYKFSEEHKDEITALQILYSRPYRQRLKYDEIKGLAEMN